MARLGAGVRKRKDGTLEKRYTLNGVRFSVYCKTSKEISEKEQEIRQALKSGTYTENRKITLDKYFEEWIKAKGKQVKGNTLKSYRTIYNNCIKPHMGSQRIQSLERREIVAMRDTLSAEYSERTTNYTITVLKIILNDAISDEIISKNPAKGIKPIKRTTPKATETIHRALTIEEQTAFMQELKAGNDFYYEFIALLLASGLRIGELSALCWSDVDEVNNVIHVNKTLTKTEFCKDDIGTPKTSAGKRDIPITETIKEILASQRKKYDAMRNANIINFENRIFSTPFGCYVRTDHISYAIDHALDRLREKGINIDHFSAHALRDTFATRFIEQGGNPQTLKTILGHSTLAMTMDLYAHVLPNTRQEEMSKINIVV